MSTYTPAFDPDLIAMAAVAKALGHPARLRIMEILATEACICGDIVGRLPLSQATVSQHLAELKKVGLIRGEVSGPRVCYGLDPAAVDRAQRGFARLFDAIGRRPREGERHEELG